MSHVFTNIWDGSQADEQIFFYFDNENMVVYPGEKGGFDRIFSRIHINNLTGAHGGGFFKSYTIKSVKNKNAVLLSPMKVKDFLEDLKVLLDLNADASFRLT